MFAPVVRRWLCWFHINSDFLKCYTLWHMYHPYISTSHSKLYSCYPLVLHKHFSFYCKYGCVHNWSLLCCTCKNLHFCLCCLPMSGSSNCTHIIDGISDLLFSCCIYFIQQWTTFNRPSSIDIFAMISYCLFTVTYNNVANLWFLHIYNARQFLCLMRHLKVSKLL